MKKKAINKYYNHIGPFCSQVWQTAAGVYDVAATVGSVRPTGGAAREADLSTYKENHKKWLAAGLKINKRDLRREGSKRSFKSYNDAIAEAIVLEGILQSLVK